jgi:hypothetical protein
VNILGVNVDRRSLVVTLVAGPLLVSSVLASCSEDRDPVADSSVAITTTVPSTDSTSVATTIVAPGTTEETTTTSTTVPETTTTEAPVVGWTAIESFPSLAYLPCCGSNWNGSRSPGIPADQAAPLLPGMYFASRVEDDVSTDEISFVVSRFEACSELPAQACEPGPWTDQDMGIVEPPGRGFTLPLDDTIRVGLSGFNCAPDQQVANAAELKSLMIDFDSSYDQLLGGPFDEGESPDVLVAALQQTPTGGFSAPSGPGCNQADDPGEGTRFGLVWRGETGPPILMQNQFAFDDVGDPSAPESASAEWIRLTALEIAADGTPTLYFYAGFYS